jgi:hypothetical protein
MRVQTTAVLIGLVLGLAGCGSSTTTHGDGAAGAGGGGQGGGAGGSGGGGAGGQDASSGDANLTCSYPDGGAPADGGAFQGVCPTGGCPSGTVCVTEVGGVAGGGGEYCAPIPVECHGTPSCACMAACVCTNGVGGRPETCNDANGSIACDNGIR